MKQSGAWATRSTGIRGDRMGKIEDQIREGTVPDFEAVWEAVCRFEGFPFKTMKGLVFKYTVKGGELFVDRKEKSITKSSVEVAYRKIVGMGALPVKVSGPKKLGVFGASYLYPVFIRAGVIEGTPSPSEPDSGHPMY